MLARRLSAITLPLLAHAALSQPCQDGWSPQSAAFTLSGAPGWVQALKPFGPDLFAAGSFGRSGAEGLSNIARWDGQTWRAAGRAPGFINDLETFDDGTGARLYAAGSFRDSAGLVDIGVRRWNGVAWEATSGPDGSVTDLFVHNDGTGAKLYACGIFTTCGAVSTPRIARYDGTRWSSVGAVFGLQNVQPNTMASLSSGTRAGLSVAGYPLLSTQNIARWNGTTWANDTAGGTFNEIVRMSTFGGQLYASSAFSGGFSRVGGSLQTWTQILAQSGYAGTIYALHPHTDNTGAALFVGGDYLTFTAAGSNTGVLGAFDGTLWRTIRPAGWQNNPLNGAGSVRAFTTLTDGRLAFGGIFDGPRQNATPTGQPLPAPTLAMNSVGTWNGENFGALGQGLTVPGVRSLLRAIENGREVLYFGGSFRAAGGAPIPYFAKFDGESWSSPLPGLNGEVRQILPYAGGLVIVGDFTYVGTVAVQGIVRIDAAGSMVPLPFLSTRVLTAAAGNFSGAETLFIGTGGGNPFVGRLVNGIWQTINAGGTVNEITIAPDGSAIYYTFTTGSFSRVYRYAGQANTDVPLTAGTTPTRFQKFAWLPGPAGPTLYASGIMLTGGLQGNLARLDGAAFTRVNTDSFPVNDLEVFDDGSGPRVYGATRAQLADGPASLVAWDGAAWRRVGNFDRDAFVLLPEWDSSHGRLYVGGDFTSVGGLPVDGVALFERCPYCGADINRDARVDSDDVIEFFAAWDASLAPADFDASGGVDGDDIIAFFAAWDGGC